MFNTETEENCLTVANCRFPLRNRNTHNFMSATPSVCVALERGYRFETGRKGRFLIGSKQIYEKFEIAPIFEI